MSSSCSPPVFLLCISVSLWIALTLRWHSSPFAGQFTEDGSFIGQYVPGKLQPPVSPPMPIMHSHPSATMAPAAAPPGNMNNSNSAATYV